MTDTITVRTATPADAPALTQLMAAAFMADPVSGWIFPDEAERARLHPPFFGPFVDGVIAEGLVLTTADLAGVSLWLDVDPQLPDDPDAGAQLHDHMLTVLGDGPAARFRVLDDLMTAQHPHDRAHAYLPFIAVDPAHQGRGVGSALLRHRLAQLDAAGVPAYLEASTQRNAWLYERLGFNYLKPTLDLPDGPSLLPMWRPPA